MVALAVGTGAVAMPLYRQMAARQQAVVREQVRGVLIVQEMLVLHEWRVRQLGIYLATASCASSG